MRRVVMLCVILMLYGSVPTQTSAAGLDALLHRLADSSIYGENDYNTAPIQLLCGELSVWALPQLRAAGYRARVVSTLTLDAWDDRNNGHTLLEVWHPRYGGWVVVDLSFDRLYPQTVASFVTERVAWEPLGDGRHIFSADWLGNSVFDDMEAIYDRVAQVALIHDTGAVYFGDGVHRARVESYADGAYTYAADFTTRFYGVVIAENATTRSP